MLEKINLLMPKVEQVIYRIIPVHCLSSLIMTKQLFCLKGKTVWFVKSLFSRKQLVRSPSMMGEQIILKHITVIYFSIYCSYTVVLT